jgi:hypothetical protein
MSRSSPDGSDPLHGVRDTPTRPARRPGQVAITLAITLAILVGGAAPSARSAAAAEPAFYAIEKGSKGAHAGSPALASVAIVGKNGWHVNAEAPIVLSLVADPGVVLVKSKLTRGDLAESTLERARFDIAFTASTPGRKAITGDARFVMCQEQACKPVRETVTLEVAVAESGPGTTPEGAGTKTDTDTGTVPDKAAHAKSKARHPAAAGSPSKPPTEKADKAGAGAAAW